jgi:hypothetical protein
MAVTNAKDIKTDAVLLTQAHIDMDIGGTVNLGFAKAKMMPGERLSI